MQYIYKRLCIRIKTRSLYNHGSLKTEVHPRTTSEMIAKQLLVHDKYGHIVCKLVLYIYISF